jgi:hypothetical protein
MEESHLALLGVLAPDPVRSLDVAFNNAPWGAPNTKFFGLFLGRICSISH